MQKISEFPLKEQIMNYKTLLINFSLTPQIFTKLCNYKFFLTISKTFNYGSQISSKTK
jgi:hypothetical protein